MGSNIEMRSIRPFCVPLTNAVIIIGLIIGAAGFFILVPAAWGKIMLQVSQYKNPTAPIVQPPYDPERNQTDKAPPPAVQPTGKGRSETLTKAAEYLEKGNIETANGLFGQAAEANPEDVLALTEYARTAYLLGRIDASTSAYLKALEKFPILSGIRAWLGYLSLLQGDIQQAFGWTQEELKSYPNSAWAFSVMGSIYLEDNDVTNAKAAFSTAAYLDHQIISTRSNNGKILYEQGVYTLAISEFLAVAHMSPKDPFTYYWLGLCNARAGNTEMAITWFGQFLQIDSASQWAQKARAEIERLKRTRQNAR